MPITRESLSQLVSPGIAEIFFNRLKLLPDEYGSWINVKSSKKAFEVDWKMAGLGSFVTKNEGGVYTFDEPLPGDEVKYVHQTFGLGFRVTEEMYEDELYGIINRMSNELANSAGYNKNVQAFSVLNNAFNASYAGFDGKSLCASNHPRLDGGAAQSNLGNTDVGVAGIQSAIEAYENLVNDRGMPVSVRPVKLIHGPSSIWATHETLDSKLDPESNFNTINVLNSKFGIKPELVHYLTDPDSWFLVSEKGTHDMRMYIRVNDQFKASDDPLTGDSINTGRHRLSVGFGEWYGVWGSPGA